MDSIYEKASETELKVITPIEEVVSLSDLKRDLEDAITARDNITKDTEQRLAEIDERITVLQKKISEATKLNIKEETVANIESLTP